MQTMILREKFKTQGDFLFRYRSYFPLIIIITGLIVYVQTRRNVELSEWIYNYEIACLLVSFLGLFIRSYVIGYSADHTSGRNTSSGQLANEINSTGLYSVCRHPLYLGNFFMWIGVALLTLNFWFIACFIFIYWLYYERIMFAEEDFLITTYGSDYINWAKGKPAFIPRWGLWQSPKYKLSWIKIIRQEKTGILNLFILFFIFNSIGVYIEGKTIIDFTNYWSIGLAFGILWYLVIKIIQKNSSLLKEDRK